MHALSPAIIVAIIILSSGLIDGVLSSARSYKEGDVVDMWAYSIFPANNPQERYPYHTLEPCRGAEPVETKSLSLGEALAGYHYTRLPLPVKYLKTTELDTECSELLTPARLSTLQRLVGEDYWYEWSVDGLPVWAPLGTVANGRAYIYTRRILNISHDATGHITAANLDVEDARALEDYVKAAQGQIPLLMTYSVAWTAASTDHEYRYDRYIELAHFGGLSRFLGTFFAFIMTVFVVLVSSASYANAATPADATGKGRKEAKNTQVLCAAVGMGIQLMFAATATACAGLFGSVPITSGSLAGRVALFYALGGALGGYAGTKTYCSMGGKRWLRVSLSCMCVAFPLAAYGAWTFVNIVGAWYGSLVAVPFATQVAVFLFHLFAVVPLTLVGSFFARKRFVKDKVPGATKALSLGSKYGTKRKGAAVRRNRIMMAAAWAFGYFCIAVELHYVIIGIWDYDVFVGYGYTFFSLLALYCCAGKMGVMTTVFMWNNGDSAWQRNAFVSGAGVGALVLLHFAVYYVSRSAMTGFLQFVAFFSVAGALSVAIALSCGSVAFISTIEYIKGLNTPNKKE